MLIGYIYLQVGVLFLIFILFIIFLLQILTPFVLRRMKVDVALAIPPKREVLVYAPLTQKQQDMYRAIVDKTIRSLLGQEKVG